MGYRRDTGPSKGKIELNANIYNFYQLLNVYWLRPETALWRELGIRAMSSFSFSASRCSPCNTVIQIWGVGFPPRFTVLEKIAGHFFQRSFLKLSRNGPGS